MPETGSQFHRDDDSSIVRMAGEVIAQHLEKGGPLPPPPAVGQETKDGIYTTENGEQRFVHKPPEQEIGSERLKREITSHASSSKTSLFVWGLYAAGGATLGLGVDKIFSWFQGENLSREIILAGVLTIASLLWKYKRNVEDHPHESWIY